MYNYLNCVIKTQLVVSFKVDNPKQPDYLLIYKLVTENQLLFLIKNLNT